jgi:hypothetical protein
MNLSNKTLCNGIRAISRRTFLRGVGVTMALPWLESLSEWKAASSALGPAGMPQAFPKRFAVVFMGNGVNPDHWWAKGSGADMQLGQTLEPLEPLKTKINVIDGLFNKTATGLGIHPPMTGNLLSGVPIQMGAIVRGGATMDQVLANRVGQNTLQASMVLTCEQPMCGYHETNFSNVYGSHISWLNADSPVPVEIYPSLAFDSLFENRGNLRNLSVLDRVSNQAAKLSRQVSSADKAKLDEYLNSVRQVERDIHWMRSHRDISENRANDRGRPLLTMNRPDNGLPEDLREHMRLMCDIVALAFQTDKTRIASLILARDLSLLWYPFLNVNGTHHALSHHDTSDGYERVVRFNVSQLAYLAQRLQAMPEGNGTVLDNSCLLFISNMFSGAKHDNIKVPVVTVGGLSGSLQTGRALDYFDKGDDNRKLCSLYLGLMDRMGVRLDRFGDADTRLTGF